MVVTVGAAAPVTWQPAGEGTPTLVVQLPDGVTLSPAPTVTGGSPATASILTSQPGRHLLSWSLGDERYVDVLDVWPADPRYLISISEAFTACSSGEFIPARHRDDMPLFVAAATATIEDICGPLLPTQRTMTFDGGRTAIVLPGDGVEVAQVSVDGSILTEDEYVVDAFASILYGQFPATSRQNVTVVFTEGAGLLPAALRLACREQVRFLWQVTTSGSGREGQELGYTPAGYAVPYLVQGMCAPFARTSGFA